MNKTIYILSAFILLILAGCEKYEDYTGDFDYSIVYFGTQKPLRTLVARNEEMSFKFGVSLGGKYANNVDEWVDYSIDTSLLRTYANNAYTLLPESYYTLSDNSGRFTIPEGEIIGDITLTLNRSQFCSDPLALSGGYALPLRLDSMSTSLDSVHVGGLGIERKDFTVIVVKYVSPYSGTYYQRGAQEITTSDTAYSINYNNPELFMNTPIDFTTISVDTVAFTSVTKSPDDAISSTQNFKLCIKSDNTCTLVRDESKTSDGTFTPVNGTWEWIDKDNYLLKINLAYNYSINLSDENVIAFEVDESYTLRRSPENDLRFEEW